VAFIYIKSSVKITFIFAKSVKAIGGIIKYNLYFAIYAFFAGIDFGENLRYNETKEVVHMQKQNHISTSHYITDVTIAGLVTIFAYAIASAIKKIYLIKKKCKVENYKRENNK
jgi:hypothetical protein